MSQIGVSAAAFSGKRKRTRPEALLTEMGHLVSRPSLRILTASFHPEAGRGRRPYLLESMRRVYLNRVVIRPFGSTKMRPRVRRRRGERDCAVCAVQSVDGAQWTAGDEGSGVSAVGRGDRNDSQMTKSAH